MIGRWADCSEAIATVKTPTQTGVSRSPVLISYGTALGRLGRHADAAALHQRVIDRYSGDTDPAWPCALLIRGG